MYQYQGPDGSGLGEKLEYKPVLGESGPGEGGLIEESVPFARCEQ